MKKIIHLSDLHIGASGCTRKAFLLTKRIIERIEDADDHIIIITGDLVINAFNFVAVRRAQRIIHRFEKAGFTVLVVPGNHDYGIGALGFHFFVELFKRRFYRTTRITYPKVDVISGVVFFGLDSTAEELSFSDMLFAQGELGHDQLDRLKQMLDDPEYENMRKVVYLHHHPWDHRQLLQLKDSEDLKKAVHNRIDALLFGHFHEEKPHFFDDDFRGFWGISRCYNVGSSTFKGGTAGRHIIMDLDRQSDEDRILNFLA